MLIASCSLLKLQDGSRSRKNLDVTQNVITPESLWWPLGIKIEGKDRTPKEEVRALKQERAWYLEENESKRVVSHGTVGRNDLPMASPKIVCLLNTYIALHMCLTLF